LRNCTYLYGLFFLEGLIQARIAKLVVSMNKDFPEEQVMVVLAPST